MNDLTQELTINEIEQVNGGAVPLVAWAVGALYSSSSITAGGLASALGVGAGIGAIVGGAAAVFSKK
jgi:hypothetical protein